MKKQLISICLEDFPSLFHPLLQNGPVFDSSSSPDARVYYLPRDGGQYLKTAVPGALAREAALTSFFHNKGLATEVLAYQTLDRDWLLTRAVPGEDCVSALYRSDPKRLCDTLAHCLRQLHETNPSGCPVPNRTADYLSSAARNYHAGRYDASLFPDHWGFASAQEAYGVLETQGHLLKCDTLLHGDYCLPNVLLKDWAFSGFIDLGNGGVGDRHIDLYWGIWTLGFNLKTQAYRERFLDAYGREGVCEDIFRIIAAAEVFG